MTCRWRTCQFWACLLLACTARAVEPGPRYELRGQILTHRRRAIVILQSVTRVFQTYVRVELDGKFCIKKLEPGAYTTIILFPRRGEVRKTLEIGPSTADRKNRVNAVIPIDEDKLEREDQAGVSYRFYEVKDEAWKEYFAARKETEKGKAEAAVEHLKRAVEISPTFAGGWNELGTIAYRRRDFLEAERCFRKGLEADPNAFEPLVNLGGVLLTLDKAGEAWEYNVRAVARRPNDPLAQSQLGLTYYALGRYDLAEKSLLEARRLDPAHFSHPQLTLAEIALRRRQPKQAADWLEEFLHYHPDWPEAAKVKENIRKLRGQSSGSGATKRISANSHTEACKA